MEHRWGSKSVAVDPVLHAGPRSGRGCSTSGHRMVSFPGSRGMRGGQGCRCGPRSNSCAVVEPRCPGGSTPLLGRGWRRVSGQQSRQTGPAPIRAPQATRSPIGECAPHGTRPRCPRTAPRACCHLAAGGEGGYHEGVPVGQAMVAEGEGEGEGAGEGAGEGEAAGHMLHYGTPSAEGEGPVLSGFAYPHVPRALEALMEHLQGMVRAAVGRDLLPSNTPCDVQRFAAPQGKSKGFITLHQGRDFSQVHLALVSWLFCSTPSSTSPTATATLLVFMAPSTDAPHLCLELTFVGVPSGHRTPEDSPNATHKEGESQGEEELRFGSAIVVMDLFPRRDLVRHPEYLHRMYNSTKLSSLWQQWGLDATLRPYVSPTAFIRALLSPFAISYTLSPSPASTQEEREPQKAEGVWLRGSMDSEQRQGEEGETALMRRIAGAAEQMVQVWVDCVESSAVKLDEKESECVRRRDESLYEHGVLDDLQRNLPRVFGDDITARVVRTFVEKL